MNKIKRQLLRCLNWLLTDSRDNDRTVGLCLVKLNNNVKFASLQHYNKVKTADLKIVIKDDVVYNFLIYNC